MNPNYKRSLMRRVVDEHVFDPRKSFFENLPKAVAATVKMRCLSTTPVDYSDILDVTQCGPLPDAHSLEHLDHRYVMQQIVNQSAKPTTVYIHLKKTCTNCNGTGIIRTGGWSFYPCPECSADK